MRGKFWTNEEIEFLKKNYQSKTFKQISINLWKSYSSVTHKASRLKLNKYPKQEKRRWTDLEVKLLLKFYKELGYRDMERMLNRSIFSIRGKARTLGLLKGYKRTEEYVKVLSERNYVFAKMGKNNFFTKENNPMKNPKIREKATRTLKESYANGKTKLNSGIFKKGNVPIKHYEMKHIPHNKGKTKKDYEPLKIVSKKQKEIRKYKIFPIKDTKIEVKIQNFLKVLGIEFFTHQYIKEIEHGYQCDILIPSINLVIECDGDYWHKYPIGTKIDKIRTSELIEKGFKVLRLWESEINSMDLNKFKLLIESRK